MAMKTALLAAGLFLQSTQAITVEYVVYLRSMGKC